MFFFLLVFTSGCFVLKYRYNSLKEFVHSLILFFQKWVRFVRGQHAMALSCALHLLAAIMLALKGNTFSDSLKKRRGKNST
jgi:hypothetical protein